MVLGNQRGLYRLAAIENQFLQVEGQRNRLELIRLNLEAPREVALARLVDPDAIRAGGGGLIERELFLERPEIGERDGMGGANQVPRLSTTSNR